MIPPNTAMTVRTTAEPPIRKPRFLWWIASAIATACLVFFLRSFDFRTALNEIAGAEIGWILVAIAANFAALPLLTEQWSRLLPAARPIRWSVLWDCVTLGIAAMNTLPFGGGHAVAVGMLAKRGASGMQGAVSLMALEQLCDAFAKLALLLVALAVAPLPAMLHRVTWILAAAIVIGFFFLLWLARHPGKISPSNGWRAKWGRHLEVLKKPRVFVAAVALSLMMKVVAAVAIYAVQRSLGIDLPVTTAPFVLAVVTFATLVAVAPGNFGVYEAAAFAAYRWLGVPAGDAAALGLVQHACFLVPLVGTGYVLTVWRTIFPARKPPARLSESSE